MSFLNKFFRAHEVGRLNRNRLWSAGETGLPNHSAESLLTMLYMSALRIFDLTSL